MNHLMNITSACGKHLCTILLIACIYLVAQAQTLLTDAYTPVSGKNYNVYTTGAGRSFILGGFTYKNGFTLKSGRMELIASDNPGANVVYKVKKAYSKISFVAGPFAPNSAGDKYNAILTLKADGKIILDEVIYDHDAPREYILDISGADEISFNLPRGEQNLAVANIKLWKQGVKPVHAVSPQKTYNGKVKLVEQLFPYYIRHSGYVWAITDTDYPTLTEMDSININRNTFTSGLQFRASQQLLGHQDGWAYFWMQKKYDKVSFIIGPADNQSSNADGWLTIKADGKIIYEKLIRQTDLAEQVVLDIKGVNQLSFHSNYNNSDFMGGLTFGVVNIYAYPPGYTNLPQAGPANLSKDRIAALPDVCKLLSNIKPFSVKGVSTAYNTIFTGESEHYTFSMGGYKYNEGIILTTGNTLMDDNISSFATFDLAEEYDYMSFTAGCISKAHAFNDDTLLVYADNKKVLDTIIRVTAPNQHFEIPLYRCRQLKFVKPGNNLTKQVCFGIADIVLYRGKPVANELFVHNPPACPPQADLIDLCGSPYFFFVGRYVSNLTNMSIDDCIKTGTSQQQYFAMKDGSKIYKGIMLEANVPIALEKVSVSNALFMFLTGAGAAISTNAVSAATGITAGAGPIAGTMAALPLIGKGDRQSAAAAFNPYGAYDSCTFTVANKSEYTDPRYNIFGSAKQAPPVKLKVFADQKQVGEFTLHNHMHHTTFTVPIYHCTQLMFWLECGDCRSGQYVLYDITVSR